MTDIARSNRHVRTRTARAAILAAAHSEPDFGGWLAHVLATAAAELGSTDALLARRPGSWEADLIRQLIEGTPRWDDDYLARHRIQDKHETP